MWPDDLNSNQTTHFLLFEKLDNQNIHFTKMINNSEEKIIVPIPGIYKIKKSFKLELKSRMFLKNNLFSNLLSCLH